MFFGKNMSRTRCTGGLVEALRLCDVDVSWYNMATLRRWLGRRRATDWVRRAWRRKAPDLVFVFCQDLPQPLLEEFREGSVVVAWVEESLEDLARSQIEYFSLAHLACMSNPDRFSVLEEHGLDHMTFLMSGFSPTFHRPAPARPPKREVAFMGTPGREGRRAKWLAEISRHFETEIFGRGWKPYSANHPQLRVRNPVNNRGFARVCASSKVVLGLNEVNDERLYFSNRTWLTLGCRGFHATHYVPGLEEVFVNGKHLVWFRDVEGAVNQIRTYLRLDDERRKIAAAGHELALREHRYTHRVKKILALLEGGPPYGRGIGAASSRHLVSAGASTAPGQGSRG